MLSFPVLYKNNDMTVVLPPLPDGWSDMTGDAKYNHYTSEWASVNNRTFASPEIAGRYRRRVQRWIDAVALKEPDRVPTIPSFSDYVQKHAGIGSAAHFYDPEEVCRAVLKFHEDFNCDYTVLESKGSGKALDVLGCRYARWSGSTLPNHFLPDGQVYQYVEAEYMHADDYDELIGNPEGWLLRKYLPRVFSGLGGLSMLPGLFNCIELPGVSPFMAALSLGPLRESLEAMLKAADHAAAYYDHFMQAGGLIESRFGAPAFLGAAVYAPYDMICDTLRGTTPMLMDTYRQPDKVLAACEALVPLSVQIAVATVEMTRIPYVIIPLHKGADGFMSSPQFEKFYWSTLKAQILALIDNGIIPFLFVEGSYDQRLDIIAESGLPEGKTIWWFDRTDITAAKEKLGNWACIGGGVPSSMFMKATPEEMDTWCKGLIETAGRGGGFFLAPGAYLDQAKAENVKAFIKSAKDA